MVGDLLKNRQYFQNNSLSLCKMDKRLSHTPCKLPGQGQELISALPFYLESFLIPYNQNKPKPMNHSQQISSIVAPESDKQSLLDSSDLLTTKYQKWTDEENKKYLQYLEDNRAELDSGKKRRTKFFFRKMAQEIGTGRNNEQCRSHHQKMLKRFRNYKNIISYFKKLFQEREQEPIEIKPDNIKVAETIDSLIDDDNKSVFLDLLPIDIMGLSENYEFEPLAPSPYSLFNNSLKTPPLEF